MTTDDEVERAAKALFLNLECEDNHYIDPTKLPALRAALLRPSPSTPSLPEEYDRVMADVVKIGDISSINAALALYAKMKAEREAREKVVVCWMCGITTTDYQPTDGTKDECRDRTSCVARARKACGLPTKPEAPPARCPTPIEPRHSSMCLHDADIDPDCPRCEYDRSRMNAATSPPAKGGEALTMPLPEAMQRRAHVYRFLERERRYQDVKFGGRPHEIPSWLMLAKREIEEAEEKWCRADKDEEGARAEVVQACAVLLACIEQHGPAEEAKHTALHTTNPPAYEYVYAHPAPASGESEAFTLLRAVRQLMDYIGCQKCLADDPMLTRSWDAVKAGIDAYLKAKTK